MAKRQNVTIKLVDVEQYDGDWPTRSCRTPLLDAIGWFNDKLRQIPEKYQATASCEIDSVSGYEGAHYGHIEISYQRPETDEEKAERLLRQAESEKLAEARELALLSKLKAKYLNDG